MATEPDVYRGNATLPGLRARTERDDAAGGGGGASNGSGFRGEGVRTGEEGHRSEPGSAGVIVAIVQARMGSSRFPGKTLADLLGRPMLARIADRVRQARTIDRVVVATSTATQDDPIA